jgi:glycine oxidase
VEARDNQKNIKIIKDGAKISINTGSETIDADWVVVAAGAWTDEVLTPLGVKLGITPVRGQLLFYETPESSFPHPIYAQRNGYITPKKTGVTLVGSTSENAGFDDSTTASAKESFIELAKQMLPELSSKKISMMTAGLRPRSPDEMPFIGPLKNHPNVIVAAGHYRNGVLLAPITAKIITDTIQKKELPSHHQFFSPTRAQ